MIRQHRFTIVRCAAAKPVRRALLLAGIAVGLLAPGLLAPGTASKADETAELPTVYRDDFENGADRWEPTDAKAWKVSE